MNVKCLTEGGLTLGQIPSGGMGDFGIDCFIVVNMVTFMMAGPSDRKQTFNFLSYHLSELQVLFQILIKSSTACMSFLTFLLSM